MICLPAILLCIAPWASGALQLSPSMVATPKALWVVNVSSIVNKDLVALFKTAQGVINREAASDRVMIVGIKYDEDRAEYLRPEGRKNGVDAAAESLAFLRTHYTPELAYSTKRVLDDPWSMFSSAHFPPAVHLTHIALCSTNDAPSSLYAALTLASLHGNAAAVCAAPADQAVILARTGLTLHRNVSGMWPASSYTSDKACASVNLFVEKETNTSRNANRARSESTRTGSVLSPTYFATWGSGVAGNPTKGYDFVVKERMLAMCLDSQATDWGTTQTRLLQRYAPLSFGFGWWTTEAKDIAGMSRLGITFLGGGDNVGLYSTLPPLTGTPQPSSGAPLPTNIPDSASLVVFSFSQGDTCSFNQKFNVNILRTRSAIEKNKTVANRYPFSLMETPLDAFVQPNVASQIAALQGTKQFLTGKPYGYASPTALDNAGVLRQYLERGKETMDRIGFPDAMVTEAPSASLNTTVTRIANLAPWLRSIIIKHPLAYPADPSAAGTEPARMLGGGGANTTGVILLSDPVHAPATATTNDIDVKATVAATLASAKVRRFFYVFLDHQMTATPLEEVLEELTLVNHTFFLSLWSSLSLSLSPLSYAYDYEFVYNTSLSAPCC